jgi:sulfur carrier protein
LNQSNPTGKRKPFVEITVNGQRRDAADELSLAELVGQVSDRSSGIAVALNSEVVPRGDWPGTAVRPGDRIDVVTAVQGG